MGKRKVRKRTDDVYEGSTVGEPSSRALREVNPIGRIIRSRIGLEIIVVPVIGQRVSKYEIARDLRSSDGPASRIQRDQEENR